MKSKEIKFFFAPLRLSPENFYLFLDKKHPDGSYPPLLKKYSLQL
jgi:hypothetical protein